MLHKHVLAAVFTVALSGVAGAQPAPSVQVAQAWARATPPHAQTGAVYLSLTAAAADRLTGATTPAAAKAELHQTTMTAAGVMQMRPLDGLDLPAGKAVTLVPEHDHLMLTGLKEPLVAGKTISVQLTFAHAPPIEVTVPILRPGAAVPGGGKPAGDMAGMKM